MQKGDSGGAAYVDDNGTSYVVGVNSISNNTNWSMFSYLNETSYNTISNTLNSLGYTAGASAPDIIMGNDPKEFIRGSSRRADIITNGSDDVALAGSGDLVNTGTGQGDVVFLPSAVGQADNGTTVVVSPGSKTIVGGTANDRLVVPVDRLADAGGTDPADSSVTDSSDTVTLGGGAKSVALSSRRRPGTTAGRTPWVIWDSRRHQGEKVVS